MFVCLFNNVCVCAQTKQRLISDQNDAVYIYRTVPFSIVHMHISVGCVRLESALLHESEAFGRKHLVDVLRRKHSVEGFWS